MRTVQRRVAQAALFHLVSHRAIFTGKPADASSSPSTNQELPELRDVLGHAASPDHLHRVVRDTVLNPLGLNPIDEPEKNNNNNNSLERSLRKTSSRTAPAQGSPLPFDAIAEAHSSFSVHLCDALGMPAQPPRGAPRSFEDLLSLAPPRLREQLTTLLQRRRYAALTPVQAAFLPVALEHRDVLMIAPTATGKTLAYVYASMLRMVMDDMRGKSGPGSGKTSSSSTGNLNRKQVELFLEEKIRAGEVCPYCELAVGEVQVCPMTGLPHHPHDAAAALQEQEEARALQHHRRGPRRLHDLTTVAQPRILVLVPTSQLVAQVHKEFSALHADYVVRFLVRASSAEEQRRHLAALASGADVLIASPETILPAMYKQKLSLAKVQTLILDEVDDIISVNHFEPLKIILAALPKGAARPQRMLVGASLPPVGYEMIRTQMLLPSHRFVLVDAKAPNPPPSSFSSPSTAKEQKEENNKEEEDSEETEKRWVSAKHAGLLTAKANLTHLVFLVGRVDKIHKLAWLYHTGKLTVDQRTIIFCNTRHNVAYVHEKLQQLVPELHISSLTSRASTTAQEGVVKMFQTGVSTCLVGTDLLSRGLDFRGVVYVVHYDMPNDMETWMHRCGRCARGGATLVPPSSSSSSTIGERRGYVYTFFQPENVRLAKPLAAYLRQQKQMVPPKLAEYARQSFVDVFNNSLFHHPTKPHRRDDPETAASAMGRGLRRYPDYRQGRIHKHFRPY